jgi:hypothetical protein
MLNAVIGGGIVRKRLGYNVLGTNLPLSGVGMQLINYLDARGVRHLIALTTTKAYHYNSTDNDWDDITPTAGAFTGTSSDRWSFTLATDVSMFSNNGGTALIISNGVDNIQYYEGHTNDKFKVLVHGFTDFVNCNEVFEFWNHFFIVNYNNGAQNIRTLAFASLGDVDAWTTGTAGGTTLTDSRGNLLRAVPLGASYILYSEESITTCRYYGGTTIFEFPTWVYNCGLLVAGAVWGTYNGHFLLGTNKRIYNYFGDYQLVPIGDRVERDLFSKLSLNYKQNIVVGTDDFNHKVHFFVPFAGDVYAHNSYAINYTTSEKSWELHDFAHNVHSMTMFENYNLRYCDDADLTGLYCDNVFAYCDDPIGYAGSNNCVFISDTGYVFALDEMTGKDYTDNIVFEVQTPDFHSIVDAEESICRWQWFSFKAKADIVGSTVEVWYSTDSGSTWTQLVDSPVSLTSDWAVYRLPLDASSRRIRFKIYQDSIKDVKLSGQFKVAHIPSTTRD